MESRDYKGSVEVRQNANGTSTITGYGIVFNSDSENLGGFIEQVDPGAVTKTLAEADIRGIANHNPDWTLGRVKAGTMRLTTDARGVRYEIDVNPNDPDGQRALAKVERGDWDGSSFCFETIQEQWDWDATPARRRLLEIKLVEMGPVAFPAYPDSTATARGALSKIAKKVGQPVERMIEALRSGEIRSLIDADGVKNVGDDYFKTYSSEESARDEEIRVGKKISAATKAALQRAVEEIQALLETPDDAEPDADADDYARAVPVLESVIAELRTEPAEEAATSSASMQRAADLARVRTRELEQLQQLLAA